MLFRLKYIYMENIQPGTVNGYKGGGNNCGYFYLVCHQNSPTGTFLKVSCKMEAEILSVFFPCSFILKCVVSSSGSYAHLDL